MEKKKRVTVTLTPKAHEKIKNYAKEKHTTVSAAIEYWIWNQLDKNQNDNLKDNKTKEGECGK
jgi:hypothetical protein